MEAKASARYVRVTPMKARRVVNLIRGKQANEALAILKFAPQGASEPVFKIVESAVANARQLAQRDSVAFTEEDLYVSEAFVDEGPTMKRFQPRAQGRAYRINKQANEALAILKFAPQGASEPVFKIVESAVANARQLAQRDSVAFTEEDLYVSEAFVDEGPTMKRFQPRAQGRAYRINKRTSHITVVLATPENEEDR